MIKTYDLTNNLILKVNFNKYEKDIMEAFFKKLKHPTLEDESGTEMFWDLANNILYREIGYIVPKLDFNPDYVVDSIYDDLIEVSLNIAEKKLKGEIE